jgi:hypothetical protein
LEQENLRSISARNALKITMRSLTHSIRLFIWSNFIERYFKDWLNEYADEYNAEVYSPEYQELKYDLD